MYLLYLYHNVSSTYECISIDLYVPPLYIAYAHPYNNVFVSNFDNEQYDL